MKLFKIGIYVFAAIALVTGANDLIQGLGALKAFGATLTDQGFADPMADNVFRYFAGLWIGVCILFQSNLPFRVLIYSRSGHAANAVIGALPQPPYA